ncbi:MAG: LysM peptidoglycan-binding domain-containing protein, partial [Spirochaetia bacterium]|nr:LysM peptidoglycan-binding domain-containing protein [Spirochaetia bacterium]
SQLEDNLRAAKETIQISETLFQEDKYLDSIAKSEESLFLTERFGEDITHASVPEKKNYDEDLEKNPPAKPKEPKHFSGKKFPLVHIVKKGESLVKISAFYFQKGKNWKEIYKLNRTKIKNPKIIFSGQKISLPQK